MIKKFYEYWRLLKFKISPASTIKSIHLQFTNVCNLNCKWCAFVFPKEKQVMDGEILVNLLQEIIENKKFKVEELNLWSAGEPLTHPNFIRILRLIAIYKRDIKKFPKVKLLTNAMLLDEELSRKIIETGAIDCIGFSIDGGSKEEYEEMRSGAKFEVAQRNIKTFLRLNNKRIETMINCVVPFNQKLNIDWMSQEFKNLFNSVDFYKLNYVVNTGNDSYKYPKDFKFNKTNKRICLAMLQGLVVIQNGDVLFCCNDFNGDYPLGNLYGKSLFEIATSEERKSLVREFFKGNANQIPLCKNCNRYSVPNRVVRNEM